MSALLRGIGIHKGVHCAVQYKHTTQPHKTGNKIMAREHYSWKGSSKNSNTFPTINDVYDIAGVLNLQCFNQKRSTYKCIESKVRILWY